ncbi:MAG: hypothetical protein JWM12_3847 [Ilumatobacteraceae bacterium]|nr:hypothetical protein [Ilumatobacteraceae bacterium]
MRDTGAVTTHRIRFAGPTELVLGVATLIADAVGVDLTSSGPPAPIDDGAVALELTVEGSTLAVSRAVDRIRDGLPAGASVTVVDG